MIGRRSFIMLLGGAAAAWPIVARAQQAAMKRVGVLVAFREDDPVAQDYVAAFTRGLAELGWSEGRNVHIDFRWAPDNVDLMRTNARELVNLQPDVILANSTPVTAALAQETTTIPIVFAVVADPVGSRFVASLPRPGGNITGFSNTEASLASKWLELLTEIVPGLKHAAMMFNPDTAPFTASYFLPSFEATAQSLKIKPTVAPVRSDADIESVITGLGREPGGGFLAMPDNFLMIHRAPILSVAAQNKVPAIYQTPIHARDGGLLSYGPDNHDIFHRAASYVDSILRGAKPSDLPVQMPIKYVMVINLRTAKALGLTVPPPLLATADEVIE